MLFQLTSCLFVTYCDRELLMPSLQRTRLVSSRLLLTRRPSLRDLRDLLSGRNRSISLASSRVKPVSRPRGTFVPALRSPSPLRLLDWHFTLALRLEASRSEACSLPMNWTRSFFRALLLARLCWLRFCRTLEFDRSLDLRVSYR